MHPFYDTSVSPYPDLQFFKKNSNHCM